MSDLWEFRLTTEKWPTVSRQPRTTFLRLQPTQRLKGSFLQITWIFLICSTLSVVDFEYFAAFCIEVASVIRLSELLGGRCKFVYVWGVIGFCPASKRATSLEYQICPSAVDTLVTGMVGAKDAHSDAKNMKWYCRTCRSRQRRPPTDYKMFDDATPATRPSSTIYENSCGGEHCDDWWLMMVSFTRND